MKISEIKETCFRIELPRAVSVQVISQDWEVEDFIAKHGDVEVIYDETKKIYRVPSFAQGRKEFEGIYAAACGFWGTN